MRVLEVATGKYHLINILPVDIDELRFFRKDRYFFNWRIERKQEVYKLQIQGSSEVLGLISIERIPQEWRIHIRLLTVSIENKGREKEYDGIAGNLISHVVKIAVREYGELACVSLRPKSKVAQYYIDKYNMNITGMTLSIEAHEILELSKKIDHE